MSTQNKTFPQLLYYINLSSLAGLKECTTIYIAQLRFVKNKSFKNVYKTNTFLWEIQKKCFMQFFFLLLDL